MKWTFGIIFSSTTHLNDIIRSIVNQNGMAKEDYEIIFVGPNTAEAVDIFSRWVSTGVDIQFLVFDENYRKGWITKKKNSITQYAKYPNVCYMHDYVGLCVDWYKKFCEFGENWDVCMTCVRRIDGTRFRDWIFPKESWGFPIFLPYSETGKTREMYVNGTYWCAKKQYMIANPLDERRCWGHGEDLEWSYRCRPHWNYKMNSESAVRLLREKTFNGQIDYSPHPDSDPDATLDLSKFELQT